MTQHIDSLAIYLTNVCGLTCEGCASYNNYRLKGHYDWALTAPRAKKWGELLSIREITLVGGETFLHPDVNSWVEGSVECFPNCEQIVILTGLVGNSLIRFKDKIKSWFELGVSVQISVHDYTEWDEAVATAEDILSGLNYTKIENPSDGRTHSWQSVNYYVNEKLVFTVLEQWRFFPNSQKEIVDGVLYMNNNDPESSHKACMAKTCHYLVDGLLYKCVLMGIASMLVEQVPLGQREKELLSQSKGLDPFDEPVIDFGNAIPQCSLCSTGAHEVIPIKPLSVKKPNFP